MRKPRDIDSELKALEAKAEDRSRNAAFANSASSSLPPVPMHSITDMLTGALLGAVAMKDAGAKEGWRKAGAGFFRAQPRKWLATGPGRGAANDAAPDGNTASA